MIFDIKDLIGHFNSSARSKYDPNGYGLDTEQDATSVYEKVVDEMLLLLDPAGSERVLDVGCGTGEILERVSKRCPDIVGLDLSPAMAKIVNDRGYRAMAYDGNIFPFEDEVFDVVTIYQVIINLPTPDVAANLIREALRVTKKGGKILVGAVPHVNRSGMPTHRLHHWVKVKILLRRILLNKQSVPYFSYPYSYFGAIFDSFNLQRLQFAPCMVPRKGWEKKYHVIMVK